MAFPAPLGAVAGRLQVGVFRRADPLSRSLRVSMQALVCGRSPWFSKSPLDSCREEAVGPGRSYSPGSWSIAVYALIGSWTWP